MRRSGQKSKKCWLVYCLSNRVNDFIGLTSFFWQHLVFVGLKTFRVFGSWELEIKSPQVKRFTRLTTLSVTLILSFDLSPLLSRHRSKLQRLNYKSQLSDVVLGLHLHIIDLNMSVSGSKLWQTWTFLFSAKLGLSVNFFPSEVYLCNAFIIYCLAGWPWWEGRGPVQQVRTSVLQEWQCQGSELTEWLVWLISHGVTNLSPTSERERSSKLYQSGNLHWNVQTDEESKNKDLRLISLDDLSKQKRFY